MSLQAFKRIREPDTTSLQRNTYEWTEQLSKNPLLSGVLLEGITMTTGTNSIEHKLGRPVRGFLVVNQSSNSNFWVDPSNQTLESILVLSSSANSTISIYIF